MVRIEHACSLLNSCLDVSRAVPLVRPMSSLIDCLIGYSCFVIASRIGRWLCNKPYDWWILSMRDAERNMCRPATLVRFGEIL
jgi:hypothetical protein